MSMIRNFSSFAISATLLLTGCGQVAANVPLASGQSQVVSADSIRTQQDAVAKDIKAQLERVNTPDNTFRFRDLSVSALPQQDVHTFRGIAARGSVFGTSLWTVYGTFDLKTRKAKIGHQVLLKSARSWLYGQEQADEVFDVSSDAPTAQQAKQDIKDQLEQAGVRPGSYSVISGIKMNDLDLPTRSAKAFTAHERLVGHGWETRYSLEGTYDAATRKATVIKREQVYNNGRPWWPVLHSNTVNN